MICIFGTSLEEFVVVELLLVFLRCEIGKRSAENPSLALHCHWAADGSSALPVLLFRSTSCSPFEHPGYDHNVGGLRLWD